MNTNLETRLSSFKTDCRYETHDVVVQRYLLDGSAHYFETNEFADEFTFKKEIASSLGVHLRDIAIVGSAKLGFSIKPTEPGLYQFHLFDSVKTSDVDIAIVSNNLFDNQLIKLYEHTSKYSNKEIWRRNSDRNSLAKYALKGWLKPDFIPYGYRFTDAITPVLAEYKMKFGRDINIGIYKSWYFFEAYHTNNVKGIHLNLLAS